MSAEAASGKTCLYCRIRPGGGGYWRRVYRNARKGVADCISLDMGGTTAKTSMVENGEVARTGDYEVGAGINLSSKLVMGGGYALKLPVIDISEIGAGGGSIVSNRQAGGLVRVGPESAGAVSRPGCLRPRRNAQSDLHRCRSYAWLSEPRPPGRRRPGNRRRGRCSGNRSKKTLRDRSGQELARCRLRRPRSCLWHDGPRGQGGLDLSRPRPTRFRALRLRRQWTGGRCRDRRHAGDDERSSIPPDPGVFSAYGLLHIRFRAGGRDKSVSGTADRIPVIQTDLGALYR